MTAQPKKRPPFILFALGALSLLCILCLIANSAMDALGLIPTSTPSPIPIPSHTPPPTATPNPIEPYVNEYGGNPDVYAEILSITDCNELQTKFEIAYANNQRETPGTKEFRWTLGYMTATDDHMREIGCY